MHSTSSSPAPLAVTVRSSNGRDMTVARIRAGDVVGEMALLDGGLRSATVEAVRDTELLRLDRLSYERLVERHPKSMLALTSLLSRRLRNTTHHAGEQAPVRTVAIVPLGLKTDHYSVAHDLVQQALGQRAPERCCLIMNLAAHTSEWFDAVETANDLVLYCAEPFDDAWTKLCLRQSDRVLLIASSATRYAPPKWLADQLNQLRRNPLTSLCCTTRVLLAAEPLSVGANDCALASSATFGRYNAEDAARLARLLRGAGGWPGHSLGEVRVVSRI